MKRPQPEALARIAAAKPRRQPAGIVTIGYEGRSLETYRRVSHPIRKVNGFALARQLVPEPVTQGGQAIVWNHSWSFSLAFLQSCRLALNCGSRFGMEESPCESRPKPHSGKSSKWKVEIGARGRAKPPKATAKPYSRHILGIDSGVQSHPKATPKPHQSHTKATLKPL